MPKNIQSLIRRNNTQVIDNLDSDGRALFEFVCLLVDIRFRNRYGRNFEEQRGRGYSKGAQSKQVLADQVSPVDDGLLGH